MQRAQVKARRGLEGFNRTAAELNLISQASGARAVHAIAEVAVEPGRVERTGIAVAVTLAEFQEIRSSPEIAALLQGLWVKFGCGPPKPHAPCHAYIADPYDGFSEMWTAIAGIWPILARYSG